MNTCWLVRIGLKKSGQANADMTILKREKNSEKIAGNK